MRPVGLLADLGRATLRGVRRCPCCGTLNGTRGYTCKNRRCAVAFRDRSACTPLAACRLITDDQTERVFSVRHRQSGPEVRGFVQLTAATSAESTAAQTADVDLDHSHCHVTGCRSTYAGFCRHMARATACHHQSSPLFIDSGVVVRLSRLSSSCKQQLFQFLADSSTLLVQRVSVSYFAVRCRPSSQFPVGFLHVLCAPFSSQREKARQRLHCPCTRFKESSSTAGSRRCLHVYACVCAFLSDTQLEQEFEHLTEQETATHLLHDSELCASLDVSADVLTEPHSPELSGVVGPPSVSTLASNCSSNQQSHAAELNVHVVADPSMLQITDLDTTGFHGNVIDPTASSINSMEYIEPPSHIPLKLINTRVTCRQSDELSSTGDGQCLRHSDPTSRVVARKVSATEADILVVRADSADCFLVTRGRLPTEGATTTRARRARSIPAPNAHSPTVKSEVSSVGRADNGTGYTTVSHLTSPVRHIIDSSVSREMSLSVSFYEWLGGVTEMINCSMNYSDNGQPEPLVFLVPQAFFSMMKERIAFGVKKRRLPNEVATVTRTQRPPLGQFLRYTWLINNIIHVKAIFDTPMIALDVTRNFVHCTDTDTYRWSSTTTPPSGHASNQCDSMTSEQQLARIGAPIQPQHYRTVLKVGCMSQSQTEPTPFIIEWMANLLPSSGVGELTLKFQFVHQHNGVLVPPPHTAPYVV